MSFCPTSSQKSKKKIIDYNLLSILLHSVLISNWVIVCFRCGWVWRPPAVSGSGVHQQSGLVPLCVLPAWIQTAQQDLHRWTHLFFFCVGVELLRDKNIRWQHFFFNKTPLTWIKWRTAAEAVISVEHQIKLELFSLFGYWPKEIFISAFLPIFLGISFRILFLLGYLISSSPLSFSCMLVCSLQTLTSVVRLPVPMVSVRTCQEATAACVTTVISSKTTPAQVGCWIY